MTDRKPPTLLNTKLYRPHKSADIVPRPHLFERLNRGLDRRLTLVCAPAGYGKTTLLAAWLQDSNTTSAWLSLDENDNDLILFLRYLITAIQTIFPGVCDKILALLKAPQLPPQDYLATELINEITNLSGSFILALDDYHLIKEEAIHQLLTTLVNNMPPQQMHLYIASRTDPPLQLSLLRGRKELLEIRADNLRFSREETQLYLEGALEEELDPKMVAMLEERTEGWITGLRLAALSLRGQEDLKTLVDAFGGSSTRYVRDYLFDEVLSRQTQVAQDFLLGTSILDRFNAELCDVVIGESVPATSHDLMALLEWNRLFLVPLDLEHSWYRYHHLFQDMLRHRLIRAYTQEEINELHRRASAWFSKKGWIEDALRHALAAEDMEGAAQLVEDSRHDLLNAEKWSTLERLINRLPENVVQERPALLVARAWVLELRFQLAEIPALLKEAETLLSAGDDAWTKSEVRNVRGEIDALRSLGFYLNDEGQRALESALSALEGINIEHAYARSFAIIIQALAYQKTGQTSTALGVLSAYLAKTNTQFKTIIARVLIGQIYIHMLHGNLHQAEQVLNQLQQVGNTARLTVSMVVAHWLLGRINYEWSRLETAGKHFSAVFELRYGGQFIMVHDSMMTLALINQGQGMPDKRDDALTALRRFALESGNTERLHEIDSLEAHLALLRSDLGIAIRWAETAHLDIPTGVFLFLEVPIISKAQILIAQGTDTSLQEATRLLKEMLTHVEAMHNTYRLIGLLAHLALAYQAKGQIDNALEVLERSLKLAQPGGFMRTYVDMGPRMAGLLKQLMDHDIATDYIHRILATFSEAPIMGEQLNYRDTRPKGELPGLLTRREYEVLTLMGQWLSNKEIAQELVISPRTVKKHISNIYRKLGVNNRMRAIEKAKELGLLLP